MHSKIIILMRLLKTLFKMQMPSMPLYTTAWLLLLYRLIKVAVYNGVSSHDNIIKVYNVMLST